MRCIHTLKQIYYAEKNLECAGPNAYSKQCSSGYKKAAPKCCDDLICKGKKCVLP